MASVITFVAQSLLEIDELQQEKIDDERVRVTFVTSGVHPSLAKVKTTLWAILGVPVQGIEDVQIEEIASGPLIKRYKITAVLKSFSKATKEVFGYIDTLIGRNVRFVE